MREGWIAAYARKRREARNKLRRRHVQNYLEGYQGFCTRCRQAIVGRVQEHACFVGSKRKLWIIEKESEHMIVESGGKKYDTEVTGWTRRFVRGDEVYTKTMPDGVPVLLSRIEAGQKGVVVEKHTDSTLLIPSAQPQLAARQAAERAPRVWPEQRERVKEVDLSSWGDELSKEAARLGSKRQKQNELRQKHVTKYR